MNPSLRVFGKRIIRKLARGDAGSAHATRLRALWSLADDREWEALELGGRAELSRHPQLDEAMALVAYALYGQGRFEEAADLAGQAVALAPERYLALFTAGISLAALGRHTESRAYLLRAHDVSPTDSEAIRRLIIETTAVEGLEAAEQEFIRISRSNGAHAETLITTVRSVTEWASERGLPVLDAGDVESIPFVAPRVWGESAQPETTWALGNKPYVAELHDVRIFGNSTLILTEDGTALSDPATDPRFGFAVSFEYEPILLGQSGDRLLVSLADIPTTTLDAGVFLSGLASNYYGHWLPDFLPKLQFLRQHPDFAGLPIIVDAGMPQSHFDHLSRLSDNPIIRLGAGESLVCQRLLVAASPTFFPVEFLPNHIPVETMPGLSMRAMRFLRGDDPADVSGIGRRRIFLARRQMKWRRLINEVEIGEHLTSLGFESVFLEELSLAEQIQLFREAEWIVAPNGSALLNLIFADTSVKLLILTQPNLFNWGTFQGPMGALGYETYCVRGEFAVSESQKHSDYRVPVERIHEALVGMGITDGAGAADIAG